MHGRCVPPEWAGGNFWDERFRKDLEQRQSRSLLRYHRVIESEQGIQIKVDGRYLINFSSNDYLGLAANDDLKNTQIDAVGAFGIGATASHLVCGHMSAHQRLEEKICSFTQAEKAVLFPTGYQANIGLLTALANRQSLLVTDRLNHSSLIDAALLTRARVKRYQSSNWEQAAEYLESGGPNSILVTDSVFSMDGNVAPLLELQRATLRSGALMVVDEAHGIGVLGKGRGALAELGILPRKNVVMMGTLGKAAGVFGAFVAADKLIIDTITQFSRAYIYTTALPPALAATATRSLDIIQSDTRRRERLQSNINAFCSICRELGISLMSSRTSIQPVLIGDDKKALRIAEDLQEDGFLVIAIRPPTVPKGTARLRVSISAAHEEQHIVALAKSLSRHIN